MQLALRPYVTAGVAVVGASLIHVTPVAAPSIEQRAVELAATGDIIDLVSPTDAVANGLIGTLPSPGDLGGALADELSNLDSPLSVAAADPALVDLDPITLISQLWMQFIELLYLIPGLNVLLPVLGGAVFLGALLVGWAWSVIAQALGLEPYATIEGLGTGVQDIYDAGVIDPALPAGVSTALGDITSLFSDAAGVLDSTTVVEDLSTALDPSVLTSDLSTALDPSELAGLGTVFDPAGIADIGTLLSTGLIPDI